MVVVTGGGGGGGGGGAGCVVGVVAGVGVGAGVGVEAEREPTTGPTLRRAPGRPSWGPVPRGPQIGAAAVEPPDTGRGTL